MRYAIAGLFLFLLTACCDTTAPTVPEGYCKTWVNPQTNATECQPWYLGD